MNIESKFFDSASFFKRAGEPFLRLIILQFLLAIILGVLVSLQPYYLKQILDKLPQLESLGRLSYIQSTILPYAVSTSFILLIPRINDNIILKYVPLLRHRIANILMEHVIQNPYTFFQNELAGSIYSRINNCIMYIPGMLNVITTRFFGLFISLLAAMITSFYISHALSFGLLTWTSIYILLAFITAGKGAKLAIRTAVASSKLMGYLGDILSNILAVKLFNGYSHEKKSIKTLQKDYTHSFQTREKYLLKVSILQGASFYIFQGYCLWTLVEGYEAGWATIGDFAFILTINISIVELLNSFSREIKNFAEDYGKVRDALKSIYLNNRSVNLLNDTPLAINKGCIEFKNVCFSYPGEKSVHRNLSVKIHGGERVGLVGYTGGGKTTFISLILKLYNLDQGTILIDNQNIQNITHDSLYGSISFIPQDPWLFHRTIKENILYGNPHATEQEMILASKQAKCHDFILSLKKGYGACIGEKGLKLSNGQRQRISIARAILKNAPIVILDEPTSALDYLTEGDIQENLNLVTQGKTTLIVAHRLSTLIKLDRVLVFENGNIVEVGSHAQLLTLNGLYKKLWDKQASGFFPEDLTACDP